MSCCIEEDEEQRRIGACGLGCAERLVQVGCGDGLLLLVLGYNVATAAFLLLFSSDRKQDRKAQE